jgi:dihydroflavonol-4-reductase
MKPILVTGATGFLGKHLIEQLKSNAPAGRLRILCRGASRFDSDPDVTVVRGDITSAADVDSAMEGVGEVYHLAGAVSRDPRDKWLLYHVHVDGTRAVCEAALKHRPEKIVVVSSSGTVAVSREPVIHNENSGYKVDVVGEWPYYLSKIYAEKLAFDYFRKHGLPIVTVNPALLLGPGDERGSSTGDIALFLEGQIMAIPLGGMCFVDARDAAAGLIGAMRSGRAGERYLLGGVNWPFKQIVEHLAEISGRRAPFLQPSLRASLLSASLLRCLLPVFGKSFKLDDITIKMSALFWYFDSGKATRELGFQARDPIETLRETVEDIRRRHP